jgi:hypothetical protein
MMTLLGQSLPAINSAEVPYWSVYAAAGLLMAWGAIMCLWGYRLFRVTLAVYGFIFGAAALGMLAMTFGGIYGAAIGALVGGVAGAILSYFMMYIWVFMLGAGFGVGLMMAAGWTGDWLRWLATFAVALLFGVLALKYVRALIIVLTSITGAGQIVWGVLLMTGVQVNQDILAVGEQPPEISALFAKYHIAIISWFALAVLAAAWQYAMSYRQEIAARAHQAQRKQTIAGLASSGSPLPPRAMQHLYEEQLRVPGSTSKVPYFRIALGAIYVLLILWGGYYEYRVGQLLDEARVHQRQDDPAQARAAWMKVVEEYPLSYGFIEARRELRQAASEDPARILLPGQQLPQLAQYVVDIPYWLPMFACAASGLAAMGVFLTRLKKPFTAILAGVVAGAASFGVVVQLEAYDLQLLSPLKPISEAVLAHPDGLYITSYVLMALAAGLTLTPLGRRKRKHA